MTGKNRSPWLALLRGINVGGKNVILKQDLRSCFEQLGFTDVATYIQSGNILFRAPKSTVKNLTARIEQGLSERFGYDAQAVVISKRKYESAIQSAPEWWGHDDAQRHNALFVLAGTTSNRWVSQLPATKIESETVTTRPGVVFWSGSKQHQSSTAYAKLASSRIYRQVTVRNHNTVWKLQRLLATMS